MRLNGIPHVATKNEACGDGKKAGEENARSRSNRVSRSAITSLDGRCATSNQT